MNISLKDVSKYYYDNGKSTKGLQGVSLDFKTDGSFIVVTGESGAGKTTLIKILTGLEDFDEGEIYFDSEPISGADDNRRSKLYSDNISFVFQDYNLVESLTSKENIVMALLKKGYKVKQAGLKAEEALKQVGLEKQINLKAAKLSGGERQRVAIARSFALDTKVIVFDEPTGNLDEQTSLSIINLIQSIRGGKLIIYITHDYDLVKKYATRHIVLADGQVISDTKVNENEFVSCPSSKTESKGFLKTSYLYSAYLMSAKKIGRFISSFILVLTSVVMVLGIFYIMGVFLTSNTGSQLPDSGSSNQFFSPFGNSVYLIQDDEKASSPSLDQAEFKDYGGLLNENQFYFYTKQALDDSTSISAPMSFEHTSHNVILESEEVKQLEVVKGQEGDLADGEVSVILSGFDKKYLNNDEAYKLLLTYMNTDLYCGNSLTVNTSNSYSGLIDSQYKKAVSSLPKVRIKNFLFSADGLYSSYNSVDPSSFSSFNYTLAGNKNTLQSLFNSTKSLLDMNVQEGFRVFSISSPFGIENGIVSVFDEDGMVSLSTENKPNTIDIPSSCGIVLPSYYQDRNVNLKYNNLSYDIDSFSPSYTLDKGPGVYYLNQNFIQKEIVEKGLVTVCSFINSTAAKEFSSSFSASGVRCYLANKAKPTNSTFVLNDYSSLPIYTRVSSMMYFFMFVFILFIMMRIIRLILNKFYYRKDADQKVLSYIGYSLKDTVIINVLQFIFFFVVGVAVIYPIWFTFVPLAYEMATAIPWLLVVLFIINFALCISIGLPTKKRVNSL